MKLSKQKWNHNECWYECKELDHLGSYEKGKKEISTCDCECNKSFEIDEYLDTKNCSYGKGLIAKLALEEEDETLDTTESLISDKKKVACKKINCFIQTISWINICLLL